MPYTAYVDHSQKEALVNYKLRNSTMHAYFSTRLVLRIVLPILFYIFKSF